LYARTVAVLAGLAALRATRWRTGPAWREGRETVAKEESFALDHHLAAPAMGSS